MWLLLFSAALSTTERVQPKLGTVSSWAPLLQGSQRSTPLFREAEQNQPSTRRWSRTAECHMIHWLQDSDTHSIFNFYVSSPSPKPHPGGLKLLNALNQLIHRQFQGKWLFHYNHCTSRTQKNSSQQKGGPKIWSSSSKCRKYHVGPSVVHACTCMLL